MSAPKTLTLKPATAISPEKLARVNEMGLRFIERKKRYILQARTVVYKDGTAAENTWVDIPLVPEVYA